MKILGILAAAALAATVSIGSASAAPLTVLEKGGPSSPNPNAPASPDQVFNDFGQDPTALVFDGSNGISIWGGVAHQSGSSSKWTDAWSIDFGAKLFNITFKWFEDGSNAFDGSFVVDGVEAVVFSLPGSSADIGPLTGLVEFVVNPILPNPAGGTEKGYWEVHATAVPIPAAGILLITALGGIAAVRRFSKS